MNSTNGLTNTAVNCQERILWGWEMFLKKSEDSYQSAHNQYGTANEGFSQYVIERIRTCISNLSSLRNHILNAIDAWRLNTRRHSEDEIQVLVSYEANLSEVLSLLRIIGQVWQLYIDQLDTHMSSTSYNAPLLVVSGRPARPMFNISADQLIYLHSLSFSWTHISAMLGVSRMTIYRRRVEYSLMNSLNLTLSDQQLQVVVREIHSQQQSLGEVLMWGRLRARGFHVTRERLRRAIRTTDPLHTAL